MMQSPFLLLLLCVDTEERTLYVCCEIENEDDVVSTHSRGRLHR